MIRKSVAVLDVRSSEVCVLVGERGVNHTFVFKASRTEQFDGFDEDGCFYDTNSYRSAIERAISAVEQVCGERIKTLYVGVPGAFTLVLPKQHEISFSSPRKIGQKELDTLFESGREEVENHRFIRATSMVFVTGDNRRVVNPVGLTSSTLSGLLSYFYCDERFALATEEALNGLRIKARYLPSELAQANYLIPSETRDEYAYFLDVGFLSSTISVLLGNGVLAQKNIWSGRGQIAMRLITAFSLPYDGALALLSRVSLYRKLTVPTMEFFWKGQNYEIDLARLSEEVKQGLDGLCEQVSAFLEECTAEELEFKPVYVTGEGLSDVRGALEHISKRISRVCEEVAPALPYYNKPSASSKISLVDLAVQDHQKSGFLHKLLNGFGG